MRLFPFERDSFGFAPVRSACVLPFESAVQRPRSMDETTALLPTTTPFFELARTGVLRVAPFAFFTVPAIEFEGHKAGAILNHYCTLLHARNGVQVYLIDCV